MKIFTWRIHLRYTNHVGNCTLNSNVTTKHVGVFAEELVLVTDYSMTTARHSKISCLLTGFGTLVVQPLEDSRHDLSEVQLHTIA